MEQLSKPSSVVSSPALIKLARFWVVVVASVIIGICLLVLLGTYFLQKTTPAGEDLRNGAAAQFPDDLRILTGVAQSVTDNRIELRLENIPPGMSPALVYRQVTIAPSIDIQRLEAVASEVYNQRLKEYEAAYGLSTSSPLTELPPHLSERYVRVGTTSGFITIEEAQQYPHLAAMTASSSAPDKFAEDNEQLPTNLPEVSFPSAWQTSPASLTDIQPGSVISIFADTNIHSLENITPTRVLIHR